MSSEETKTSVHVHGPFTFTMGMGANGHIQISVESTRLLLWFPSEDAHGIAAQLRTLADDLDREATKYHGEKR